MDDGTPSSCSDSEMAYKVKKNPRYTFKIKTKMHFYSLKNQDDALFKNSYKTFLCTKAVKDHAQF